MRSKPFRPGDNCPTCSALLAPHCDPWHRCGWVLCSRCHSFGTVDRWHSDPSPRSTPEEP